MPGQFTEERIRRADVQSLLCRVSVHPVADYAKRFPGEMPSRVTVTLTDGRVLTRALLDYPGFRSRPQTWSDAVDKFMVLSAPYAAESVLSSIVTAVNNMENIRVAELTRLLRDLGAPASAAARDAA
jgi:2-methylcitrate dehydratase